tara:strand:+ start:978 stop:2636 length:1659 start_codon:yes stop_codon:yes gene_type:complete
MAEKEVSFLTDKSAKGRFLRALTVAVPSIALAKNDPYLVKSLYDKEAEFGKLDREDARDLIKSSATSITNLINKNKVKRQSRVDSNLDSLTKIKGLFPEIKDNSDIALIQKRGLGTTLQKIKEDYSLTSIVPLLSTLKENVDATSENLQATKVPNTTLNELAEAMAGPAKQLDFELTKVRSAPASGPITSFVSGEMFSDEKGVDITPQIRNIVKASDITPTIDDAKSAELRAMLDTDSDILTQEARKAAKIVSQTGKDIIGDAQVEGRLAKALGKIVGVDVDFNELTGVIKYAAKDAKLKKEFEQIIRVLADKGLKQKITLAQQDDPRFLSNLDLINQIVGANTETVKVGDAETTQVGGELKQYLINKGLYDSLTPDVSKNKKDDKNINKKENKKDKPPIVDPKDKDKEPDSIEELIRKMKKSNLYSVNGKKIFTQLAKRDRAKYMKLIEEGEKNLRDGKPLQKTIKGPDGEFLKNPDGSFKTRDMTDAEAKEYAEIFKRRYSVEGFALSVIKQLKNQYGFKINNTQQSLLVNLIKNNKFFDNPYADQFPKD